MRLIALGGIIVFVLFPLLSLVVNIKGKDLAFVFSDENFYLSLFNSIRYTFISSVIATLLALFSAYLLDASSLKHKNFYVTVLTFGMLVPTLSIGLGIRVMFGTNGFLDTIFGLKVDGIGYLGLILGSIISSFPSTFLILYDALRYEDKGPYDAANIMGISRLSTFFHLTLPYLKVALVSAFFASFTWIFSDYGIPMELAGKAKTLPMYLYNEVLSSFQYGRGAIAGLFLLVPSIVSFLFDLAFKDNSSAEKQKKLVKPSKSFNWVTIAVLCLVAVLLFLPQLSFVFLTFIKSYPNDMTLSLINIRNMFFGTYGLGIGQYVINSVLLAILTGAIGTSFAYFLGYLAVRKSGRLAKVVNLLSVSTIAIPGIVLGIGFMFLFKSTNGIFYGTIAILVAVNVFHFLGTPFLLAKNCLTKINRDYEIIGDTLGISRFKILKSVLIPNSYSTLIEMFSYYFLNSMITISAVAFLCTYSNQPLAILINSYEKSSNYEMQGAISVTILCINVLFRVLFNFLKSTLRKNERKESENHMTLSRYQFELLTYLEANGKGRYSQRFLSDTLTLSLGTVNKLLKDLHELGYVESNSESELSISDKGLKALEPYRVRKAIILAAGFGSRLAPVTLDTPKPLVTVNGVRIIDTLLDALVNKGITNINIVVGYRKDQFEELKKKYPTLTLIENEEFNTSNNIVSIMKCIDMIDRCYICEADLYITNPDVIRKYEYTTNYLGAKVKETDDWCFKKSNGYVMSYDRGGEDCYQAYGISYWNEEDSEKLKADIKKVYNSRGGKEYLWENVPMKIMKKNYKIEIRSCHKSDIIEIDNFMELVAADPSYRNYPGSEKF
ncbi:MAG: ABC transporter permease subunit [Spirochaetales bacterium]|nr:ABC transporter permease subunit [Spirochaetales bacterium]